jgi:hypothetical protein
VAQSNAKLEFRGLKRVPSQSKQRYSASGGRCRGPFGVDKLGFWAPKARLLRRFCDGASTPRSILARRPRRKSRKPSGLGGQESHDGRAVGGHSIAAGFCHHCMSRGLEQYRSRNLHIMYQQAPRGGKHVVMGGGATPRQAPRRCTRHCGLPAASAGPCTAASKVVSPTELVCAYMGTPCSTRAFSRLSRACCSSYS